MNSIFKSVTLLIAIGWCGTVQASPVELDYSGLVFAGNVTGISAGDAITLKVFADNGGAGLLSQTWTIANITSVTLQAGSYSATTSGPASGSGGFSTDALGQLLTLTIGASQSGTDTNGRISFLYFMNGGNPFWFPTGGGFIDAVSPPNINNTTISLVSETPLPAAFPLFATGLGALGLLSWRRKKKAAALAA